MLKNMSSIDRLIRIVIAVVLVWLNISGTITGAWAIITWIVAVIFVLTSAVGYCHLYHLLGISTKK